MTRPAHPQRFGPFVLLRSLGAGGMGSVWLALHAPDGPAGGIFVVKRLHTGMASEPTMLQRFVHEAEVASHVRNPHVAELVAMGTVASEPFLATEYVFGVPLATLVDRIEDQATPSAPLRPALCLGLQMATGVAGIHSAVHRETEAPLGLVHRDLGARNVMVGFDGRARVIDLGLGKSVLSEWQTSAEILAGSPDYMPPEQAVGLPVDGRADVYALAVTIWELLAGRRRIRVESVRERIERCMSVRPETIRNLRPELSARFESLLLRAMEPDPDERLPHIGLLQDGLREELKRLGGGNESSVAAWLESSCATLQAQEARQLEEDRQAGLTMLSDSGEVARVFVGDVSAYVRRAGRNEAEGRPLVPPEPSSSPASEAVTVAGAWAQIKDALAGGRPTPQALFLLGGLMLFVTLATAWLTSELSAPATPRVEAPVEAVPLVSPPELAPTLAGEAARGRAFAPITPPDSKPPSRRRSPKAQAPRTTPGLSAQLQARQHALVDRVRTLRGRNFDGRFPRALTRLSARITSARTSAA
ncbi:MAG: serine/threonine-protein kinase, partial [Myxococcota bacterium]